jgi:hypothetical protein
LFSQYLLDNKVHLVLLELLDKVGPGLSCERSMAAENLSATAASGMALTAHHTLLLLLLPPLPPGQVAKEQPADVLSFLALQAHELHKTQPAHLLPGT